MMTIAVIIPYFQKRAGILRRALASVLQQRLPPDIQVDVIVIDDGSPVPARTEAEGLDFAAPYRLNLVEQPNGGVAAARNAGLRRVSAETTYIAFLDSDDIWKPEHLPAAISALERGYDFYFCDSQRAGSSHTAFSRRPFDPFLSSPGAHRIADSLYELDRTAFFDHSLRGRVFLMPTIVYRRSIAPDMAFNASLRVAGEDCLFLFQLIQKSKHICCSSQLLVTLGEGVNIYAGKFGWNDPGHLIQHMGRLMSFYEWRKSLVLSVENDRFLVNRIRNFRRLFAFLTVRYFLKYREFWSPELINMTRDDPEFLFWYPPCVLYVVICYPLRLYTPMHD